MLGVFGLIGLVCAVWVIYDVWTNLRAKEGEKIIWTIAAIVLSVLTAIVYYFVKKRK